MPSLFFKWQKEKTKGSDLHTANTDEAIHNGIKQRANERMNSKQANKQSSSADACTVHTAHPHTRLSGKSANKMKFDRRLIGLNISGRTHHTEREVNGVLNSLPAADA